MRSATPAARTPAQAEPATATCAKPALPGEVAAADDWAAWAPDAAELAAPAAPDEARAAPDEALATAPEVDEAPGRAWLPVTSPEVVVELPKMKFWAVSRYDSPIDRPWHSWTDLSERVGLVRERALGRMW
jgi:hypothetical protein